MYLKLYTLYAARLNQSILQMAWGAYGLIYRDHIQKAVPLTVVDDAYMRQYIDHHWYK